MTVRTALGPLVALSASLALSGCIAAVIPLAAGAMVAKRVDDIESRAAKLDKAVETASATRRSAVSDRKDVRNESGVVLTSLTSLPPPDTAPANGGNNVVASFRAYALEQAAAPPGSGTRPNAIIPDASDLALVRGQCGRQQAAVFIDLDPGRGTFDPLAPGAADASLGAALADLRSSGVKIVWFSRLGTNFADAARTALANSGLDPASRDELVVMRDIGERKQTLRDEVASRLCPIAILGDERPDFDELYLYLKNPESARALDAMIGKGWFLASPFGLQAAPAAGATP